MHCNGCHGEAAGLNLRSYKMTLEGGKLGKIIIAGDAENSLLIHFVEGRRGPSHRMPVGGAPLSAQQIATLRRWIDEGARQDKNYSSKFRQLDGVQLPLRINCRAPFPAYLTILAIDPITKPVLWSEVVPIKSPKERNDAAEPNEPLHWTLRQAIGWPLKFNLQLIIEHTAEPNNIEFTAISDKINTP